MGHIASQNRKAIESAKRNFQDQSHDPKLDRIIRASGGRLNRNQARNILRRSGSLVSVVEPNK